ncbi:serine hydrolase domain-containing protein [Tahibacter amnicola]|uniref:Beta-lactamase family protein n=1 Tax=Tahibacter amnicola TaxID=2976241 RepID=A0ABY6B832_9GAMM|nr:serine hydrolase domain-containing protein [Tahibacter amnicola]UXI66246.1 beta-lactamase family protein [Tahibacter amnicola]
MIQSPLWSALDHGLRPSFTRPGEAVPRWSLSERMAFHHVPGVAIAIVRDGGVVEARGFGVREAGSSTAIVTGETVFNVGSVSKVALASTVLQMVAAGQLQLDRDVNTYLTQWQVPNQRGLRNAPISLRMLLSHTSGLTVHGFPDYQAGETLPTLLQTLEGLPPARTEPVRRRRDAGILGDYSGGGIVVAQMVVEDQTRKTLDAAARARIFEPLGMVHSRFSTPPDEWAERVAKAHGKMGEGLFGPRGWPSLPQEGAQGLWTSAHDLGRLTAALMASYRSDSGFLPQALAVDMMSEVAPSWHGLGPRLDGDGTRRIFHHGGSNVGYHAWMEGYLETGDGFVILTNGDNGQLLRGEIRNALSDAIGLGVNPVLHTLDDDPDASAGFAGTYVLATNTPNDLRRELTDVFNFPQLTFRQEKDGLTVTTPEETGILLALAPSRFFAPTVFGTRYEFHRDGRGAVRGVTVRRGESAVAYYQRRSR